MQTSPFTETGTLRSEALRTLLSLMRHPLLAGSAEAAHSIEQFLAHAAKQHPETVYNAFGYPNLLQSIEGMAIAVHEIGLAGHVLTAYALRHAVTGDDDLRRVTQTFGTDVADALRAFQRVEAIEGNTEAMHTDNFRNLLMARAADMRVVLMLIADAVAVMRRIKDAPQEDERRRTATEAACLYAPLAHKLGLYKLKSELEDLSLKYLEHDAYYMIKENLNATKRARDAYIERFTAPIRRMLDAEGLRYHMKGRTKSIHSIWQKMKKQQCGFSGVYDLFAIRIILDAPLQKEKEQCWKVFSLITNKYESNLKRLRDWLTVPKSNGYESLHITVRGPEDKWVEVQIRTQRMDEIAEHG